MDMTNKKLSSPKDFDTYLSVAKPNAWIPLIAVGILMLTGLVWVFTAEISTTKSAFATAQDNHLLSYLSPTQAEKIMIGADAYTDFGTGVVVGKSQTPVSYNECKENIADDYALDLLTPASWNIVIETKVDFPLEEGAVYEISYLVEKLSPLDLVFQ